MRDDLLDAQASVDWAVSQFPSHQERVVTWLRDNIEVAFEETPSPATHDVIVLVEKALFPRSFNVEFGAYINAIRSGLDILATTLADRHDACKPDDAYFPVARSEAAFISGKYKGAKLINGLPGRERAIIESLKPYKGGNEPLWTLHQLDIQRKHRRLINVDIVPRSFSMQGPMTIGDDFTPVASGPFRVNEKTVIGLLRKGAPRGKIKMSPRVAVNVVDTEAAKEVIGSLNQFASLTASIIKLFDY